MGWWCDMGVELGHEPYENLGRTGLAKDEPNV